MIVRDPLETLRRDTDNLQPDGLGIFWGDSPTGSLLERVTAQVFGGRGRFAPLLPSEAAEPAPRPAPYFRLPGGELDVMVLVSNTPGADGRSSRQEFSSLLVRTGIAGRLAQCFPHKFNLPNSPNFPEAVPTVQEWTLFASAEPYRGPVYSKWAGFRVPPEHSSVNIAAVSPVDGSTVILERVAMIFRSLRRIRADRSAGEDAGASDCRIAFNALYRTALGEQWRAEVERFVRQGMR